MLLAIQAVEPGRLRCSQLRNRNSHSRERSDAREIDRRLHDLRS